MHAASVHPEPGSNSLIIVYILSLNRATYQSRSALLLFKELHKILNSKEFFGAFLCLSCCSIFKEHIALSSVSPDVSFAIISHVNTNVKAFLKVF